MYTQKLLTVTYPNHHKVFTERVWNFFTAKHKVDLNLQTDDEPSRIGVHQLVVEIFLPHVAKLLQEQEAKSQDVIGSYGDSLPCLTMTGHAASGLQLLIELAYCGTVGVTEEQLESLKTIAGALNVPLQFGSSVDNLPEAPSKSDQNEDGGQLPAPTNKRKGRPKKYVSDTRCSLAEPSPDPPSTQKRKRQAITRSARVKSTSTTSRQKSKIEDGRPKAVPKIEKGVTDLVSDSADNRHDSDFRNEDDDSERSSLHDVPPKAAKKSPPMKRRKSRRSGKETLTKSGKVSRALYQKQRRQARSEQRCTLCEFETKDKVTLAVHVNAKHDPSVTVMKCPVCSRPFLSQKFFDRHVKMHEANEDSNFRCDRCSFISLNRMSYYRHLTTVHKVSTTGKVLEEQYRCDDCQFACMYKSQLTYHQKTLHATEKQFKCEHCDYASKRKGDLGKHVSQLHLGDSAMRIICHVCGYRCLDHYKLKRHLRTHTGERPYVCSTCGVAYAHSNKLKYHMETHSGVPSQFTCHLCGHQFRRKDNMLVHLRACSNRIKHVPDLRGNSSDSH